MMLKTNESSISTPTTRRPQSRTTRKSQPQESGEDAPVILPRKSSDSLSDLYRTPEFSIAWDNDVKHHLARHLLHLRRYREWSQVEVAKKVGTSQSAIARIETAQENITASTLERVIAALKGRLCISIQPEEFSVSCPSPWWEHGGVTERTSTTTWTATFIAYQRTDEGEKAMIGFERTFDAAGILLESTLA